MYDLHCHILPGLDDGADGIEEAVEMADLACREGTEGIAATPHTNVTHGYRNYWSTYLLDRLNRLQERLDALKIPVRLYAGQEIYLTEDVPALLAEGRLITLNRSRYILSEFSFRESPKRMVQLLQPLLAAGYLPIIAHPERYACVEEDWRICALYKELGCAVQINKGSVTGAFGPVAAHAARRILDAGLCDLVASDGHSVYRRRPELRSIHEWLSAHYSIAYADHLTVVNPCRILNDGALAAFPLNAARHAGDKR